MELIYLWIDDFRNIKQQEFNFSNQYSLTYDQISNEISATSIGGGLALKEKNGTLEFEEDYEHYLNDFFHPKISNITAIIGKNSSGKSNVIDFILTAISSGSRGKLKNNYILLFKKNSQPFFFGRTEKRGTETSMLSCQGIKLSKINPSDEWESMFYSNVADNKNYIFEDSTVHNFSFKNLSKLQSNKIKFVTSPSFDKTLRRLSSIKQDTKNLRFVFYPTAYTELSNSDPEDQKIKGVILRYRRALKYGSNYNKFKYGITINLLCFLYHNGINISPLLEKVEIDGKTGFAEKIASLDPKVSKFLTQFVGYTELGSLSSNDFELYQQLLKELVNTQYDFGVVENNTDSIIVDFSEDFKSIIYKKAEIFNTQTLISHDWSQLSSGMRAYLNLFSQLYYLAIQITGSSKNLLICIDEGDLYLHPEWQKNFLNDLIEFVTSIFDTGKIQIILTSHSPFLISDLPKENILLLNESGEPTKHLFADSSFGGNIHQLFTNQFFLSTGSIGEFAKIKIQTLLKDIPNMIDDNVNNYKKRIEMIGEPILRYRLLEVFETRIKQLSNEKKIDWHMQQIEKLRQK
ncbi:ATP-binding protein [Sphingobacterium sp. lm-10]|uniref:AAA family ATPase n=1 Tax=Sphingobacterium sp. lm-10 TaxID=2944904 RepID=UPI002021C83E|nr:AAA family ATPase [Sphingobacterium sp. lm-10]MCL7987090.1 ATP-binding protein [Sphingobacterium sp. lm-10]